jgi:NADH-quinone oxidoreductase subunit A
MPDTMRGELDPWSSFIWNYFVKRFTKSPQVIDRHRLMQIETLPILLFIVCSTGLAVGLLVVSRLVGPHRAGAVKQMPYESGMNPIHDTRRRFDVRFHLVAIAFLVFDVELLFLYPWAVASRHAEGIDSAVAQGLVSSRGLVFGEVLVFIALLAVGFIYAWRKGVFQWR